MSLVGESKLERIPAPQHTPKPVRDWLESGERVLNIYFVHNRTETRHSDHHNNRTTIICLLIGLADWTAEFLKCNSDD